MRFSIFEILSNMKRGTTTDFFESARKKNTRSDACEAETKETSSNKTSECLNESVSYWLLRFAFIHQDSYFHRFDALIFSVV